MASSYESESTVTADIYNHLTNIGSFDEKWHIDIPPDDELKAALSRASKKQNGNAGKPDLLYINRSEQLIILGEVKPDIKFHSSQSGDQVETYAQDGVLHYLNFFKLNELDASKPSLSASFGDWKIFGLAFAGNFASGQYLLSTHVLRNTLNSIEDVEQPGFLTEKEYISTYRNLAYDDLIENIDNSSKKLNEWLRTLDSQKRPVLLSALMICLISDRPTNADFRNAYRGYTTGNTIVTNVLTTVSAVLEAEDIPLEKIAVLLNELQFLKTEVAFEKVDTLRNILVELETNVIPLFGRESNYDILAKFYHDFLSYAGVTNVKNGIVLTPMHVCELFADLVDIRANDVFLDPACGTGSFLITARDRLTQMVEQAAGPDISDRLERVNQHQLVGFETNSTMYALSISNMLFRGDGKSRIFHSDFFSSEADDVLGDMKPTIGFVNPPYAGKDTEKSPTKKEIQFLERMLDNCSRYGVIIAPWSTFLGEGQVRARILSKHNLVYSINMPLDLFQPNASASTTICVFKTHLPHSMGDPTTFFDLTDDGFVLTKKKGRVDLFGKWSSDVRIQLLEALEAGESSERGVCVREKIGGQQEWLVQDYIPVDFGVLSESHFVRTVKEFAVFSARRQLGALYARLTDGDWIDLVLGFVSDAALSEEGPLSFEVEEWGEFSLCDPDDDEALFRVEGVKNRYRKQDVVAAGQGDILWVTTSNKNNGVTGACAAPAWEADVLTVDSATDGKTFFQPFPFVGSDHVEVLYPNEATRLNALTGLFFVTLCDLRMSRYGYGRKRAQKRLIQEKVLLPVDQLGQPDWDWIEAFIRALPYSSCLAEWEADESDDAGGDPEPEGA